MIIKNINESHTVQFTNQGKMLLLLGVTLAGISIMCEVLFFLDFTETLIDKLIATITAIALVGCQFVFLGAAMHVARLNKKILTTGLTLVLVFLLIISVSGTASFFESRFVSQQNINLKNSDVYVLEKQLINDLDEQNKALRSAAKVANSKGNSWYAGKLLKEAQQAAKSRRDAINNLKTIQPTSDSAGASLAAFVGELRWTLWFVMAALVDVCALLCFAVLNTFGAPVVVANKNNKKEKHVKQNEIKQAVTKENIEGLIKTQIIKGHFGPAPRVRAVMGEHKKCHSFVKSVFDDLINQGVLVKGESSRTFNLVEQT